MVVDVFIGEGAIVEAELIESLADGAYAAAGKEGCSIPDTDPVVLAWASGFALERTRDPHSCGGDATSVRVLYLGDEQEIQYAAAYALAEGLLARAAVKHTDADVRALTLAIGLPRFLLRGRHRRELQWLTARHPYLSPELALARVRTFSY